MLRELGCRWGGWAGFWRWGTAGEKAGRELGSTYMGACILIKLALPDKLTRLTVPESSLTMGDMLLDYIFPRYREKAVGQKYLDVVFRTVLPQTLY